MDLRPLHVSFFLFFFWPHHAAYGILVPPPEIKPSPHAVKAQSLNQWTAREDSLEVRLPLIYLTHYYHYHSYCYWKVRMGGLDARPSKVKKQAGLVERKVCFISDAGSWGGGGGGWTSVQRPIPPADKQGIRAFIDRVGIGVTCRNSTVIFNWSSVVWLAPGCLF